MKRDRKRNKVLDYLGYLGVRAISAFVWALPARVAVELGKGLGLVVYWAGGKKRIERAEAQLRLAFGDGKTPAERRRIARECYKHLGLSAIETIRTPKATAENWRDFFPEEDLWAMYDATGPGGAIMVTGHVGAYQFASHVAALARKERGGTVSGIERPLDNPYLADWTTRHRGAGGMKMISKFASFLIVRKALSDGDMVCFAFDQDGGKRGIFADFLGYPASTWTSAAEIHLLMKLPIVISTAPRVGYGPRARIITHGKIDYEAPPKGETKEETRRLRDERVKEIVEKINELVGGSIREHPEQWMWMHRRWKTRPKGDPVPVVNGVPRPWLLEGASASPDEAPEASPDDPAPEAPAPSDQKAPAAETEKALA